MVAVAWAESGPAESSTSNPPSETRCSTGPPCNGEAPTMPFPLGVLFNPLCPSCARSEAEPPAELHLERDRNGRRRGDAAEVADRFVVGRRRERVGAEAVAEVRAVEDVVELGEQIEPLLSAEWNVLGEASVCVNQG